MKCAVAAGLLAAAVFAVPALAAAGEEVDAGAAIDAGAALDAGAQLDAAAGADARPSFPPALDDEDGCDCNAGGRGSSSTAAWLIGAAAMAVLRRRAT